MRLFKKEDHVKIDSLATDDAIKAAAARLSTSAAFIPAAAQANTTNQSFVSADAVVLTSSDKKDKKLCMNVVIYKVRDDEKDPAMDLINADGVCALLGTTKMRPIDGGTTGTNDKVQMPRTLCSETKMCPLAFAEVRLFQQLGKATTTAASFPMGTKIRLSNVVATPSKADPSGPLFLNAKAATVIGEADDAIDGFYNLAYAVHSKYQKRFSMLASPPLFGGAEGIVNAYGFLGTSLEWSRKLVQTEIAAQLKSRAADLDGVVAGKDTAYETPVFPSTCDLEMAAEHVDELPDGSTLPTMLCEQKKLIQLPIFVQGLEPGATIPAAVAAGMLQQRSETDVALHAQVTSVDVRGDLVKVFIKPTLALCGDEARSAISYEQAPATDLPGPALCFKKSLKELAIMLDTRANPVANWLSKELIPHADMVVVMPVYHRDVGDRVFGDFADGVNWATSLVVDVPSAIRRAGFPVSADFVKEFSGGSETITELDIDDKDVMLPPSGQDVPAKVALRTSGYLAVNQRTTNTARLVDGRLPATKQGLTYYVVFPGSATEKRQDMSTQMAEEALRCKFENGDLTDNLMANTVLYALATEETNDEGPDRKKQAL